MYDALMRRLLERLLTPMHNKHREELLDIKRAHAKELRRSLQHLCQLESACVDKCTDKDVEEYKAQIKTKLLSDCEYHVCEERRHLSEQIDEEVDLHVRMYQQQIAEEERTTLQDRRKWLTERLVVMQAQGAGCPGDRSVIQHLRAELRACELKFEKRDRELMDTEMHPKDSSLEPRTKEPQKTTPPQAVRNATQSPSQSPPRAASHPAQAHIPAAPSIQAPQNRRPSRGASPKPPNDMTFPIGRASGKVADSSPGLQFVPFTADDLAGAGPPSPAPCDIPPRPNASGGRKRSPVAQIGSGADGAGGVMSSPSFGADGAAGFGRQSESLNFKEDELGKRCPSFGELNSETLLGTSLPLYDWPFAASDMMCEIGGPKSDNESHKKKPAQNPVASMMPDILLPLKQPLARPYPLEKAHDVGSHSAGVLLGVANLAPAGGSSLKSPRQVLPPMASPRRL